MKQGSIELLILIIVFLALQAWWIIPIFRDNRNNNLNKENDIKQKIKTLEDLYKK